MPVAMARTESVRSHSETLGENGCKVLANWDVGTVMVTDEDGVVVYRALQKGRRGPWIVRCTDGARIKWKSTEEAETPPGAPRP